MSSSSVVTVSTLGASLVNYQYNPAGTQQTMMAAINTALNNPNAVVDPTNPFVMLLEASTVGTVGAIQQNTANTRQQYPYAAQQYEDLYTHMSDLDYLNRFATPTTTTFSIIFQYDDIINNMVEDPTTGIRMIVIPRNTFFTIADVTFSIQYPVQIRQMLHGGLNVIYDNSILSPLQTLQTNVVPFQEITANDGTKSIKIDLAVIQTDIVSQTDALNASQQFSVDIAITDQFYFCRVYVQNSNGGLFTEIATTHTAQIYDPATPTAVIKVNGQTVTVTIPQVYTSTSLLNTNVRIDVYQTVGVLNMLLWQYQLSEFAVTWEAYDPNDNTVFTAPLGALTDYVVFSNQTVSGGGNAVSFLELRQQVITNSVGPINIPITSAQLDTDLTINGYTIVRNIDNVTDRKFLAIKPMPNPAPAQTPTSTTTNTSSTNTTTTATTNVLLTPAAASIETIILSATAAVTNSAVIDNGTSITLTPNVLYQSINGIISMVTTVQVNYLLSLTPAALALAVEQTTYLYSPFHYVLDMTNNQFESRPYYLDDPTITTKSFITENDTTLIEVGTGSYSINRTSTGYNLQIVTQSTSPYQSLPDDEVFVQLSFIPVGEQVRAYINGVQTGTTSAGERIYTFDLSSTMNLDSSDNIELTQFFMFNTQPRIVKAPLNATFDILYSTNAELGPQWQADSIDNILGTFLLPSDIAGITQEQLFVVFGSSLTTLWHESRSVVSTQTYQTYATNVPATYLEDDYQKNSSGSAVSIVNGAPVFTKLHSAGDPVLDGSGNPVYQHLAGDPVLDGNGDPIINSNRTMLRQVDLMLIEGEYWFANDSVTNAYKTLLVDTVVSWLTQDLVTISESLLENTEIYFYPQATLGMIEVSVGGGLIKSISANQIFEVTLYVPATVNADEALKSKLSTTTIQVINQNLSGTTVSVDGIITALKAQYATDVTSVLLTGLGGAANNFQVITLINAGDSLSIAKTLVAQPDNTLSVQEAVTINFVVI